MNHLYAAGLLLLFVSFAVADHHKYKFCGDFTKCQSVTSTVNVSCVANDDCTKYVADGKADFTLADTDRLVDYADKLKIVFGQKLKDIDVNFVTYYGLAVVQKNSTLKLNELKGKNTCHTGVGKTVGWKIPVGYFLSTKKMPFTKNQYKSASDYFGDSCAPGIKGESEASAEVKDDLCKLCNGSCDTADKYANYEGAFKCMADGNNDRVGFVKQDTADKVVGGKYGSKSDYKLLCKDGTTKALGMYKDCYIAARPLAALVTSKDTPDATVTKMQIWLKMQNLTLLIQGGMASDGSEKLEKYEGTVEKYVGDYGKYYNALKVTNSAPANLVSFALQAIVIFAFMFLV